MKRLNAIWILVFCFCFVGIGDVFATTIKITPKFDKHKKPEGPNPNAPSHTIQFELIVEVTGIPTDQYCKIDAKLVDVTTWKGTCANYPQKKAKTDRDLKFLRGDNLSWKYESDKHLSYKTMTENPEPTVTKTVYVRSYDYAAYGKLVVTVKKRGLVFYRTEIATPKTQSIPIDENENRIADGWENDDGQPNILPNGKRGYDPTADNENVLNNNHGDSIIVLEEYRGVWLNATDEHKRLSPSVKEVMIAPQDKDKKENINTPNDMWSYSISRADAMPSHTFYKMHPNYVKNPFVDVRERDNTGKVIAYQSNPHKNTGWINVNNAGIPGSIRFYAIRVAKDNSRADGPLGIAPATPNTPSPQTCVYVYYLRIKDHFPNQADLDTMVEGVIGHEAGHCVNLDHCNVPFDRQNNMCLMQKKFNPARAGDPFLAHHDAAYDVAAPPGATIPPFHDPANPKRASGVMGQ